MTITGLAPLYRGSITLPVLGRVQAGPCTDRVSVRLVSGQSPKQFADRAEGLAHGFGAHVCRVRAGQPGTVVLELVRRDALAEPMPALPIPDVTNLRALPVGRREDGTLFALRLHGTHLLIAGATGAGKGSYLWCLVRAMLPAMAAGLVRVLACDPKLMELAFGRVLFDRYGRYAADPADIAALLELAEEGTRLADACHGVSDETWAQVRKHYDDDQIAALVSLVAMINAANRLAVIVHQQGGSYEPGMFAATFN